MKKNREIVCGLAAWLLTACFFLGCFLIPGLSDRISALGNNNILIYGMTLVLFCILFLGVMALTGCWTDGPGLLESTAFKKASLVILLASQLPFWTVCVSRETEQVGTVSMKYGWHTQPLAVMILLFLAELAVFFWMYENLSLKEKKGEWIVWLTYAAFVVLIFYCMYTPNIYGRGEQGDNYHAHAYFNSVYNVYQGMPYTHNVTSIYGHYGLFFKIPMKLVHGDFRAFVLMIAGIGTLAYICAFLVLQMLVRSRVLRILAALALTFPVLGMRGGYYWQVWPHRVIFPMLFLLYGTVILKKKWSNLWTAAGGYLLCMLAILWNTETGLLLTVSWAGLYISRLLSRKKWKIRELFFCLTECSLYDSVFVVSAASDFILMIRNTEQHDVADSGFRQTFQFIRETVHTVAELSFHRRNLLLDPLSFSYKQRVDERRFVNSCFSYHFAQSLTATQSSWSLNQIHYCHSLFVFICSTSVVKSSIVALDAIYVFIP